MEGMTAEIRYYVGAKPPRGWAFCKGQTLGSVAYASLFREIGNDFGGNGSTHFKLPNLADPEPQQGVRFIICVSGFPPQREASLHLGEITLYAGRHKPHARLVCDGRALDVDEYLPLFSVIGHQFGGSEQNFLLPDLTAKKPHQNIDFLMSVVGNFPN